MNKRFVSGRSVLRLLAAVGLSVAASMATLAPAGAATTATVGQFQTLAAGSSMGLSIRGVAVLVRSDEGTTAYVRVVGLLPGVVYGSHVHNQPCQSNEGGGHYRDDPTGPGFPPNEIWLSSSNDPRAGITAGRRGSGIAQGSASWVARPEAQSIVIHAIPPGGTPAGGPKIACADLR